MEIKQVIVLRKDLNMRKGKMVAQGAHASLTVCLELERAWDPDKNVWEVEAGVRAYAEWIRGSQTKVCVSVSSEQELCDVYNNAKNAGIPCSIITDAGKTEFGGVPTKTAVAVGPYQVEKIDEITGKLPLL